MPKASVPSKTEAEQPSESAQPTKRESVQVQEIGGRDALKLSGKALATRGKNGITVTLFPSKFNKGEFSAGLQMWGKNSQGEWNPTAYIPVSENNVVWDADKGLVTVTIEVHVGRDANFGAIDKYMANLPEPQQ